MKCYSELIRLPTYEERLAYLTESHPVAEIKFGGYRYLEEAFYAGSRWKAARRKIILRDNGCDLGIPELPIYGMIIVHHMIPITLSDLRENKPWLYDPEYLISLSDATHKAITYGSDGINTKIVQRKPNDTIFWERIKHD